jgi:hypothetical protein
MKRPINRVCFAFVFVFAFFTAAPLLTIIPSMGSQTYR